MSIFEAFPLRPLNSLKPDVNQYLGGLLMLNLKNEDTAKHNLTYSWARRTVLLTMTFISIVTSQKDSRFI